ncbi:hypothetical protein [Stenotrophomonas maltophilia]|uniref:hypothetical protein n=1 Tax=Stenotrophomonas maltophilia TaxID=40324 RepID=UPI0021AC7E07|nr:hypothetical protein [Stenotrophomonas maltophilia]
MQCQLSCLAASLRRRNGFVEVGRGDLVDRAAVEPAVTGQQANDLQMIHCRSHSARRHAAARGDRAQPEKDHDFQRRVCTRCGMSEDWAGPDCFPPEKKVEPRTLLPFDPAWLVQPLQWLRDAPANLNAYDRRHRAAQAAFLLEKLQAHIEECKKP